MRFLLVAPIKKQVDIQNLADEHGGLGPLEASGPLSSRSQSQAVLLRQDWTDIDVKTVSQSIESVTIELAAYCKIRSYTYFALEAELYTEIPLPTEVSLVEELLSEAAVEFISNASTFEKSDMEWVARYALLNSGEIPLSGWMPSGSQAVDVAAECGNAAGGVELTLGWGNGVVQGWNFLNKEQEMLMVRGIIDAQLIWHEASRISETNLQILENIEQLQVKPPRRSVRLVANSTSENSLMTTRHQLLYDEVLMKIQGIRRIACLELLRSWGYDHFNGRIVERISSAESQVNALQERLNSRYQSAVEKILILLSMLTIVDLALSLISTSFSGSTKERLHVSAFGVFSWIRESNADIVLLGSIILTLMISLVFVRRR